MTSKYQVVKNTRKTCTYALILTKKQDFPEISAYLSYVNHFHT